MGRIYTKTLPCGCMLSPDGGGGLMPCNYGYGCGKKGCNKKHQCEDCIKQEELCQKSWEEWDKSAEKKEFDRETWENNNPNIEFPEEDELKELIKEKIGEIKKLEDFEIKRALNKFRKIRNKAKEDYNKIVKLAYEEFLKEKEKIKNEETNNKRKNTESP